MEKVPTVLPAHFVCFDSFEYCLHLLSGIVMFEIKEVAPAEQKIAFWARDIKMAREFNKGGGDKQKPVDVKVLRQGVGRVLAKREKSDSHIPKVKIRTPVRSKSSSNVVTVDTLFPLGPRGGSRPNQYPVFSTSAWNDSTHGPEIEDEDEDDVRYVGLEDMGRLLGFDEDDEDDEAVLENASAYGRIGWGRYL